MKNSIDKIIFESIIILKLISGFFKAYDSKKDHDAKYINVVLYFIGLISTYSVIL